MGGLRALLIVEGCRQTYKRKLHPTENAG
jgi:hypothetical protein